MVLLFIILLFSLVPIGVLFLLLCMDRSVHKSMVVDSCEQWDYGTFDQFTEQFNKTKWEAPVPMWTRSFFNYSSDSKIHAGIIRFNGKGMVLGPFDYLKFQRFLEKHKEMRNARTKGLWE
jgi:hypothetical protein